MIQVKGLNHLTIRVSNLEQTVSLFCGLLGFSIGHRGSRDAYLECGSLWLAVLERPVGEATDHSAGMDHFALTVSESDFDKAVAELRACALEIVKGPLNRGVGRSVYFLGPDKIVIELHTSGLNERMTVWT